MSSPSVPKSPEILDKIVDVVLAHRPKPQNESGEETKEIIGAICGWERSPI
jgi:hypothetical protein